MTKETGSKSFVDHLLLLIKWRGFIVKTVLIACVLATIITFLIRPKYTATATIMPPNPQQEMMFGMLSSNISSTISQLTQMGGIAGMSTPSDLYAAIINSDRIRGVIISRFNLKKVFRTRTMYATYKRLDEMIKTSVSPVGIISVSVTYTNKTMAADIANALIEELDKFNTQTTMTLGKKYRIFIEERLRITTDSLSQAEDQLRSFQEKHRTIAIGDEIRNAIETIAKLKAEIIMREVQRGSIYSGSSLNNPYLQNIDRELNEYKRQLSSIEFGGSNKVGKEFGAGFSIPFSELPEVTLQYARLSRDIIVQNKIFELLTEQYEQAKIMELRDTPTVQVLDSAAPPERKSYPKKARVIVFVAIFSTLFSIVFSYIFEALNALRQKPAEYSKWLQIYDNLKEDVNRFSARVARTFQKKRPRA